MLPKLTGPMFLDLVKDELEHLEQAWAGALLAFDSMTDGGLSAAPELNVISDCIRSLREVSDDYTTAVPRYKNIQKSSAKNPVERLSD